MSKMQKREYQYTSRCSCKDKKAWPAVLAVYRLVVETYSVDFLNSANDFL